MSELPDVVELSGDGPPLRGRLRVPGDKSISHRALLFSALADGESHISGLADGEDVVRTRQIVEQLGARVKVTAGGSLAVHGGPGCLHEPSAVLNAGNSGTAIRLVAGLVAGWDWLSVLEGDASVNQRPMGRVIEPLRSMGADVRGRSGDQHAPLVIKGGDLRGIDFSPAVASAQVKSAVLIAGIQASGSTLVHEPVATRAHTEEMLAACGADLEMWAEGGGQTIRVRRSKLRPFDLVVPGDPSQAAFWIVAGCIVPDSQLKVEGVYIGPGRTGFIEVLRRMGAQVEVDKKDNTTADITATYSQLRGTEVKGAEVPGLIDEIPVLAVAAAVAEGTTVFADAAELFVKESNRARAVADGLSILGAQAVQTADGLRVTGEGRLAGGEVSSRGDHRVGMAMAVAGMASPAVTRIRDWGSVATSYPTFLEHLWSLRAG